MTIGPTRRNKGSCGQRSRSPLAARPDASWSALRPNLGHSGADRRITKRSFVCTNFRTLSRKEDFIRSRPAGENWNIRGTRCVFARGNVGLYSQSGNSGERWRARRKAWHTDLLICFPGLVALRLASRTAGSAAGLRAFGRWISMMQRFGRIAPISVRTPTAVTSRSGLHLIGRSPQPTS